MIERGAIMRNKLKKTFGFCLALCMLLSCVNAFALSTVIRDAGLIDRFTDTDNIYQIGNASVRDGKCSAQSDETTASIVYKLSSYITFANIFTIGSGELAISASEDGVTYEKLESASTASPYRIEGFGELCYLKIEFSSGIQLTKVEINTEEPREEVNSSTVLIDEYEDLSKAYFSTPGLTIQTSKPEEHLGDEYRVMLGSAPDKANIIYQVREDIVAVKILKYAVTSARQRGEETELKFYVSPDNKTYTELEIPAKKVPVNNALIVETHELFSFPAGMRYFKIEFNGTQVSWNPEIGRMELYFGDQDVSKIKSFVEDTGTSSGGEGSTGVIRDPNAGMETVTVPSINDVKERFAEKSPNETHPRILGTKEDFDRARSLLQTDEYMKRSYNELYANAEVMLTQPVCEFIIPDGKRLLDTSRLVKKRLETLGFVYQMSGEERFAQRAYEEMAAAAAFPNWNPSHFLDVGEMSYAFGVGYDWCYDYFTEEQRKVIIDGLKKFGLDEAYAQMKPRSGFTNNTNNWNTVCCGGIGVGALAIFEEYPDFCAELISIGVECMPKSMVETAPNGCYPEGPGYWAYGTSYSFYIISAMNSALGTDFGLSEIAGMKETGYYPMYIASNNGTFNYADGGAGLIGGSHLFWMAKHYNEPLMSWYQKAKFATGDGLAMLWYDPAFLQTPEDAGSNLDMCFYGSESLATFRSSFEDPTSTFAGLKAGDNQSSHGDLDVGTFIFDAMGVRWAKELGAETYDTPGYWESSPTAGRWTYYGKRAEGHNTLVINPDDQADQNVYAVDKVEKYVSEPGGGYAIVDMAQAYKDDATVAKRGLMLFDARSKIMVQDELKCKVPSEVYWFMHTDTQISLGDDPRIAILTSGNKRLKAEIVEPAEAKFEIMDTAPLPTSPNPKENIKRPGEKKLAIHLENVKSTTINVVFTPIYDEMNLTEPLPEVVPLKDWKVIDNKRAEIEEITLDGYKLANFKPTQFAYEVELPYGAPSAPVVAAKGDNYEILQADGTSGSATIRVKGNGDDILDSSYIIQFRERPVWDIPEGTPEYRPVSVEASDIPEPENIPENTLDGNIATRWSAEGAQWINYDLGETKTVSAVSIAFWKGDTRRSMFSVDLSENGKDWTRVYDGASSGQAEDAEVFIFDATPARYIRVNGTGNSESAWNSILEFRCYGEILVKRDFVDIQGHWAQEDIRDMAQEGVVNGVSIMYFEPESNVTIAEFIALAARAAGLGEIGYKNAFTDVKADDWYAKILQAAYDKGYIVSELMPGGKLNPTSPISREQMTAVVSKIVGKPGDAAPFADQDQISPWAVDYVSAAAANEIVKGVENNRFDPQGNATRAQAAVIIKRMLQNISQ